MKITNENTFMNQLRSIKEALNLLERRDRLILCGVGVLQLLLSFLDLLGVMLVGATLLLVSSDSTQNVPNNYVETILRMTGQLGKTRNEQIVFLGIISAIALASRTILAALAINAGFKFLAKKSSDIATSLAFRFFSQPLLKIRRWKTQEAAYALTLGVDRVVMGIIGTSIALISDIGVSLILFIGLLSVNFNLAVGTIVYFACIGLILHRYSSSRGKKNTRELTNLNISATELVIEAVANYRDFIIRNQKRNYVLKFSLNRLQAQKLIAEVAFLPLIGKYFFEVTIIFGAIVLSFFSFRFETGPVAVGLIGIFIMASLRISPAIMRIQQGLLFIAFSSGMAAKTFEIARNLPPKFDSQVRNTRADIDHRNRESFIPIIKVKNVNFNYGEKSNFEVKIKDLVISEGQVVAIVGPSGAGKSTIADLLLGLIDPISGSIEISGQNSISVHEKYPGIMGFVPQDVYIANVSLKENITWGHIEVNAKTDFLEEVLSKAQLSEFVSKLPNGVETMVGELGSEISGGQKQRIGIARALFTKPKLILLDEATSSLDAETEVNVSASIRSLRGEVTLIVIAHRLSTIQNADIVLYVENGEIVYSGTFDEVRKNVPNFEIQAKLSGL